VAKTDRDTLIIGSVNIYPPHEYLSHDGSNIGFSIELIENILQNQNIAYKIKNITFGDYLSKIFNKEIDLLIGVSPIKARESLLFSDSYYTDSEKFVFEKGRRYESFDDVYNKTIAVIKHSSCSDFMRNKQREYSFKIIEKSSTEEVLKAINIGECDLGYLPYVTAKYIERHISIKDLRYSSNYIRTSKLSFAARKDSHEIITLLNREIKKLKDQAYIKYLENKWIVPLLTSESPEIVKHIFSILSILIFIIIILFLITSFLQKQIKKKTIKLEEALIFTKKAQQQAEESNRLKSIFLSNMSHEIRTPLNSICGFSNLLADDDITAEEKSEYIKVINNNVDQLTTLISDIIDIAKIEANQMTLVNSDFSVNDVLHDISLKFKLEKRRRNKNHIDINFHCPLYNSLSTITSDENRVNQIISNLIGNALKFTEHGEISFGYKLIDKDNKEFLEFYVRDTGIGIKKKDLYKIFEIYQQTESKFTHLGTGLGLSICKKLCKMLGGDIWAESEFGKGSCFYFTVPYVQPIDKKLVLNHKILEHYKWDKKSVLVIESQSKNKKFIESLLNPTGINKIVLDSETKGLDYLKDNGDSIDMVLINLDLPKTLGIEASRQIKEINSNIPIIALSAMSFSEESDLIRNSSCDDFITRPMKEDEFYDILNIWLNK
jgi:signal transduction histidine kinase/CheY-like chemotaxis protein